MTPDVRTGIVVGLLVAVVEATVSVALLKWAWKRKSFYAIWGGSTLGRFLIFGIVALVIQRNTNLNLAATLVSLVLATMLLMIIEVSVFLKPKK